MKRVDTRAADRASLRNVFRRENEAGRSDYPKATAIKTGCSFLVATIGQTAVMAIAGVFLYLYVFSHLIGNLQIWLKILDAFTSLHWHRAFA